MALVLYIIAQEGFQDTEYADSKKEIESAGHEVVVASMSKGRCVGKFGMKTEADLSFYTVKTSEYDAVVVIGGPGVVQVSQNKKAIEIVKEMYEQGKLIAGICMGPSLVLTKAGALEGKKATGFQTKDGWSKRNIINSGATYIDAPVVVDGKLITANGPEASKDFGKAIVEALKKK